MEDSKSIGPYKPLSAKDNSEIRIIKLELDSWDSQIQCELQHVSLLDRTELRPSYLAISYVWGHPTTTHNITLNGAEFSVTKNLFSALQRVREYLRSASFSAPSSSNPDLLCETHAPGPCDCLKHSSWSSSHTVYVWVDALCINQLDLNERASQVAIMGDIFSNAESVLAHAGESELQGETALTVLRTTYEEHRGPGDHKATLEERDSIQSISMFCNRTIFKRVWVVQELVLQADSAVLLYGKERFSFRRFLDLVIHYRGLIRSDPRFAHVEGLSIMDSLKEMTPLTFLDRITEQRKRSVIASTTTSEQASDLLLLLQCTSHLQASDERDRVYGVLGLLQGQLPVDLTPTYSASPEDIFFLYTKWLLEYTGDLIAIEGKPLRATISPSWVTNLQMPVGLHDEQLAKRRLSRCSNISFKESGKILCVKGLRMGKVSRVLPRCPTDDLTNEACAQWLRKMERDLLQVIYPQNHKLTRIQVLMISIVYAWPQSCREEVMNAFESVIAMPTNVEIPSSVNVPADLANICKQDCFLLENRSMSLYMNSQHRIEEGDEVFFFKGSHHSTVIRQEENTRRYKRIGVCEWSSRDFELFRYNEDQWAKVDLEDIELA